MVCMAHGNPRLALKIGLADFTSNHQEQGAELSPRQEPFFVDLLVSLHQHKLANGRCDPISMDLLILPSQLLHQMHVDNRRTGHCKPTALARHLASSQEEHVAMGCISGVCADTLV